MPNATRTIHISFTHNGESDREELSDDWGLRKSATHSFTVDFCEDTKESEACASVIARLMLAIKPPRPHAFLARLVIDMCADEEISHECERTFCKAAEAVLNAWQKEDKQR